MLPTDNPCLLKNCHLEFMKTHLGLGVVNHFAKLSFSSLLFIFSSNISINITFLSPIIVIMLPIRH